MGSPLQGLPILKGIPISLQYYSFSGDRNKLCTYNCAVGLLGADVHWPLRGRSPMALTDDGVPLITVRVTIGPHLWIEVQGADGLVGSEHRRPSFPSEGSASDSKAQRIHFSEEVQIRRMMIGSVQLRSSLRPSAALGTSSPGKAQLSSYQVTGNFNNLWKFDFAKVDLLPTPCLEIGLIYVRLRIVSFRQQRKSLPYQCLCQDAQFVPTRIYEATRELNWRVRCSQE